MVDLDLVLDQSGHELLVVLLDELEVVGEDGPSHLFLGLGLIFAVEVHLVQQKMIMIIQENHEI